jgi:polar amino acid transport system substrate-binding protein
LVAAGKLAPSVLTTHRFPVEHAEQAYAALAADGETRAFGIVLEYAYDERSATTITTPARSHRVGAVRVGLIGAGTFARATLLPALKAEGAELRAVATEGGLTAADAASRFGFERAVSSAEEIFADDSIDAVVIATRHVTHARLAAQALEAGKAVFTEKPLALEQDGLLSVEEALRSGGLLMVGFNRRMAPLTIRLRAELGTMHAPTLVVRVNAGPLPDEHWLNDQEEGGGRLLGEGCHFVDLLVHLADSAPVSAYAVAVPYAGRTLEQSDDIVGTLRFANGAVGALIYSGSGDRRLPKERIEAFGGGVAAVIEDFRSLQLYRGGKRTVFKSRQDKGHRAGIALFLQAVRGNAEAPAVETYLSSTRATLALAESLRIGSVVDRW